MPFVWHSSGGLVAPVNKLPQSKGLHAIADQKFKHGHQVHSQMPLDLLGKAGYATTFENNSTAIMAFVALCSIRHSLPTLPLELWLMIVEYYGGAPKMALAARSFGRVCIDPPKRAGKSQVIGGKSNITLLSAFWSSFSGSQALLQCPTFFGRTAAIAVVDLSCTRIRELPRFAFAGALNLHLVGLPECLAVIGEEAFADCVELGGTLSLPNVAVIGQRAFKATRITGLNVPMLNAISSGMCTGCTELVTVNAPSAVSGSTHMFYMCTKLTDVRLSTCASLSADCTHAFACCFQLTTLAFGILVGIAEHMFSHCKRLTLKGDGSPTRFAYAVAPQFCYHEAMCAPDQLTGVIEDVGRQSFNLSNVNTIDCVVFGSIEFKAFASTRCLTSVKLAICARYNKSKWDYYDAINDSAFRWSALKDVELTFTAVNGSVTSVRQDTCVIGPNAFADCTSLRTVRIESTERIAISEKAFAGCVQLTAVLFKMNVNDRQQPLIGRIKSDVKIHTRAFCDCHNLNTIIAANGIVFVEWGCFVGCHNLARITCVLFFAIRTKLPFDVSRHCNAYKTMETFVAHRDKSFCPAMQSGPLWIGLHGNVAIHMPTARVVRHLNGGWYPILCDQWWANNVCIVAGKATLHAARRVYDAINTQANLVDYGLQETKKRVLPYCNAAKVGQLLAKDGRSDNEWIELYLAAFPYAFTREKTDAPTMQEREDILANLIAYRALHACGSAKALSKWLKSDTCWPLPGSATSHSRMMHLATLTVNAVCSGGNHTCKLI